jgi:hypothetical protein
MIDDLNSGTTPAQLGALVSMPYAALRAEWRRLYGTRPPKGVSRQLLVRAIAYEIQANQLGGLKPAIERKLQKIAGQLCVGAKSIPELGPGLRPGARLIRDWNGVSHVVDVVEDGFIWNDQRHRSLSAIARAITGARWSGPRFFGLNRDAAA